MSRIPAIALEQADPRSRALLDGVQNAIGMVPNLYRVAAQSHAALSGLLALTGALRGTSLPGTLAEQVALATAERNGCDYCLAAHTLLGRKAGLSDADIAQARDARAADPKTEAALRFVALVVDNAGRVSDADLSAIRLAGFSNAEIVELVALAVLNVFTNTLNNVAQTDIDFPRTTSARAA